jgi:hypothetical protein
MDRITRDKLFLLLHAASRFETRLKKRNAKREHGYFFRNFLWIFQVIPFLVAVFAGLSRKYFDAPEVIGVVGLALLLLSYLATLLYPFIVAWVNRSALSAAAKNPLGLLLENARTTATVDARVIPRLLLSTVEDLELLLLEIKAEKEFFEKRLSLVVGTIDKIGLGPGLLAAGVSLTNLKPDQSEWISALAYATPILYMVGLAAHFLLMRLDRFVKVVELAVSRKKSLITP